MVECRDLSQHNPGQPLREESPYCVLVKKETATPVSSRPEKSERAVAGSGRSVDNDRMLSLTGVRGRKEGKREKKGEGRAQKVTVLFTLSGRGRGNYRRQRSSGEKSGKWPNKRTNEGRSRFCPRR